MLLALVSFIYWICGTGINPARFTGRELALLRTIATGWSCNR